MRFFRSIIFYFFFYSWTCFYFIIFSQVKIFTKNFTVKVAEFWSRTVISMVKFILRIDYQIIGIENIPKAPFIIASNHQSAWETFFLPILFSRSIFILKSELKNIPIFRNYFKKLGFIYVNKENSIRSLKDLLKNSKKSIDSGVNSIIIFPEGTRVLPGEDKELSSGVAALYKNLKIPVLPIKHNSGEYWINKKFLKKKEK